MTNDGETQRQFAHRIGLSHGRIAQLAKDGLPLLSSGRIDVDSALTWLEQNLDHARSARAKGITADPEPAPAPAPNSKPQPTSTPIGTTTTTDTKPASSGMTLAEARRQHEIVRVATARMRYDKDRGRLVIKDEVKIWVFNRFRKERNAHLGWIMRSSSLMAVELGVDPSLMHSVLDRYLREHLAEVSKAQSFDLPE